MLIVTCLIGQRGEYGTPTADRKEDSGLLGGKVQFRDGVIQRVPDEEDHHLPFPLTSYGHSEGSPTEQGIRQDAQAALEYALAKGMKHLVAYGQSIGGAVAIDVVHGNPGVFKALIVENTFTSIRQLIPDVLPWLRLLSMLCTERWENGRKLGEMIVREEWMKDDEDKLSILLIAGAKDELIPLHHMEALWKTVKGDAQVTKSYQSSSAKHWEIKDESLLRHYCILATGTHNDTCALPEYYDTLAEFMQRLFGIDKNDSGVLSSSEAVHI